ncbi:drug/metabolite transporter (DMT)-like permease [Shimia isoporae]|uniref:Drug/metabolite transporter (DMT)-like permease n=1 Tax=Shimia isoporae TaxID=647720 RepID=A0A4R1NLZ1_9RHOB|nr:DMT family transporter [Shimia isoporae]TCL09304.1 drug/metabolite transporter (DMT)-like permease [Shimia isoporae]
MSDQKSLSSQAWLELLLLAAIWGGIFLANRIALNEIPVFTLVAHRVFWAALILWVVVVWRRLPIPVQPSVWLAFLVMGLLNNIIPFSLLNWAQLTIESGLTSIFNATTAIFGVLVAAILLPDERLSARKAIGVSIGFIGVATAIGLNNLADLNPRSLAQLAAVGATLSYAFAGVWARKQLQGQPPQIAAAGMLTGASLVAIPLAHWLEGPISFNLQPATWSAITYCATIATAGAYLLYYRVLDMAGSGNLMLVTLLIPPFAIVLGAVFLGESLAPRAYFGFGLLAVGLLVLDGRLKLRKLVHFSN